MEAPAGVVIREATPADEPAMVDLEHASAIHHAEVDPDRWRVPPRDAIAAYRRKRQAADPDGGALLAVADGVVVGMVEMLLRGWVADPGGARVPIPSVDVGISVSPAWRGRGVGTALMRAAEDWARSRGALRIILDLAGANTGALRLYERLGYEVHGLLMDKRLDGSVSDGTDGTDGAERSERSERGGASSPARQDHAHYRTTADEDSSRREMPPGLEGELVRLRPIQEGDREALVEVLSDPSVVAIWDTRGAHASTEELIAGEPGWFVWAIEVDGEFAGSIQASEEIDDPDYRHAGIDIFLSSRFQGRGLGTDAVRTVARWLIEVRGHHRLTIDPAASNERAIRTYEKVGFRPVGVMRRYERGRDGTFHDGLLMDMLADELR